MDEQCICGNEIYSRGMCSVCYQKDYRAKHGASRPTIMKLHNAAEIEFIKNYFTHNKWIYQPVCFRLSAATYSPDFYDAEKNIFIEVVGTRQAFNLNKDKYKEFSVLFPKIILEFRNKEGNICSSTGKDIFPPEGHSVNSSSDSAELTLWSDGRPERETTERDTVA